MTVQFVAITGTALPRRIALAVLTLAVIALARPAAAVEVQKVVSPGGIEAWLVEEHTVPVIAMNFAFQGGSAQDPEGKLGLSNLLSTMLDEGAGEMESQEFQQALEESQAKIDFDAGRDHFYGEITTLSFLAEDGFELLRLALNEPRFDAEPLERMRRQIIAGIRTSESDPDSVANRALFSAMFPHHPYGRRDTGTVESVQSLTHDDLVRHHAAILARGTLKVAIVGAITAEELGPLLDRVFGALPETGELTAIADTAPEIGATVVKSLDVPQSAIRLGLPSLKRKDPDFLAAYVMNHILGGGSFTSRLYGEVREKRGLAYSVYSHLLPLDHSAVFFVGAGTRRDNAELTVEIIRKEIERMAEDGPTPEELQKAKDYLIGSYPLRFDSSGKIAGQLLGLQLDDLPAEYIETRNSEIQAVTLGDVKRVANRILAAGKPAVVIVGQTGS